MRSDKSYSMKQAVRQLPSIVSFVEQGHSVGLTRDGEAVAHQSQKLAAKRLC